MTKIDLKGINAVKATLASGKVAVYYYHRQSKKRLRGEPGSKEFLESYIEADGASLQRLDGTVSGLIRSFCTSPEWKNLQESTRSIMRLNLNAVDQKFGSMRIQALSARRIRSVFLDWRDRLAEKTPRAADAKLAALARVLSWAFDRGEIEKNPLESFHRAYRVDRSEIIWLPEHIDAFVGSAPPALCAALMLALHTGQRQGDILSLTWANYDGRALTLRQGKTGARVFIPCTAALRGMLDATPRSAGAVTILVAPNGRPWTSDSFKKAWRAAVSQVPSLRDLHFHDLRGTAVTMLSEAGCTTQEIASITGHSLPGVARILDVYLARTRTLSERAITKLEEHRANIALQNGLQNGNPKVG